MERMTQEEWQDLEPRLAGAERAAYDEYMSSAEVSELSGVSEYTPGCLLLQRLKVANDQEGIRLFRAMEMYHHELTRADISAAFLRGKEIGQQSKG
jgi:hypothetical protein